MNIEFQINAAHLTDFIRSQLQHSAFHGAHSLTVADERLVLDRMVVGECRVAGNNGQPFELPMPAADTSQPDFSRPRIGETGPQALLASKLRIEQSVTAIFAPRHDIEARRPASKEVPYNLILDIDLWMQRDPFGGCTVEVELVNIAGLPEALGEPPKLRRSVPLDSGALKSLASAELSIVTVGVAAARDSNVVALRIQLAGSRDGAYADRQRWARFFAGDITNFLGDNDWALSLDGQLLQRGLEASVTRALAQSTRFRPTSGPRSRWSGALERGGVDLWFAGDALAACDCAWAPQDVAVEAELHASFAVNSTLEMKLDLAVSSANEAMHLSCGGETQRGARFGMLTPGMIGPPTAAEGGDPPPRGPLDTALGVLAAVGALLTGNAELPQWATLAAERVDESGARHLYPAQLSFGTLADLTIDDAFTREHGLLLAGTLLSHRSTATAAVEVSADPLFTWLSADVRASATHSARPQARAFVEVNNLSEMPLYIGAIEVLTPGYAIEPLGFPVHVRANDKLEVEVHSLASHDLAYEEHCRIVVHTSAGVRAVDILARPLSPADRVRAALTTLVTATRFLERYERGMLVKTDPGTVMKSADHVLTTMIVAKTEAEQRVQLTSASGRRLALATAGDGHGACVSYMQPPDEGPLRLEVTRAVEGEDAPAHAWRLARLGLQLPAPDASGSTVEEGLARIKAALEKGDPLLEALRTEQRTEHEGMSQPPIELSIQQIYYADRARVNLPSRARAVSLISLQGKPHAWCATATGVYGYALDALARPRLAAHFAIDSRGLMAWGDALVAWGHDGLWTIRESGSRQLASTPVDDVARLGDRLFVLSRHGVRVYDEALRSHRSFSTFGPSRLTTVGSALALACGNSIEAVSASRSGFGDPLGRAQIDNGIAELRKPQTPYGDSALYVKRTHGAGELLDFSRPELPRRLVRYDVEPWFVESQLFRGGMLTLVDERRTLLLSQRVMERHA